MSLGWKFYVKYIIVIIPLLIMMTPSILMPKDKAIEFTLKSKLISKLHDWVWK